MRVRWGVALLCAALALWVSWKLRGPSDAPSAVPQDPSSTSRARSVNHVAPTRARDLVTAGRPSLSPAEYRGWAVKAENSTAQEGTGGVEAEGGAGRGATETGILEDGGGAAGFTSNGSLEDHGSAVVGAALSATPRPQPPDVVVVMHRYAPFIMAAHWGLQRLGRAHGFAVQYRNLLFDAAAPRRRARVRLVRVDLEEPNFLLGRYAPHAAAAEGLRQVAALEAPWHATLTLCPYTARWVNAALRRAAPARTAVFYPFAPALIPPYVPPRNRTYDLALAAWHKVPRPVQSVVERVFPRYKSVWIARAALQGHAALYERVRPLFGLDLRAKLRALSASRICVVYNAYMDRPDAALAMRRRLRDRPALWTHSAFARFVPAAAAGRGPEDGPGERPGPRGAALLPQLKARTVEAAACGCVMLVYNDGFNVIERYFTPDVHFLYWSNHTDFERAAGAVLRDFAAFEPMIERARRLAFANYTVAAWVRLFLEPLLQRPCDPATEHCL